MPDLIKKIARQAAVVAIAAAGLLLVGAMDSAMGFDVALGALYAAPIAFATWYANVGWGLLLALAGAGIRYHLDQRLGHHFNQTWIPIERTINFGIIFGVVAFGFRAMKIRFRRQDQMVRRLEGILPICVACKRIKNEGGEWVAFEGYAREVSAARPEPCVCPDCMRARYR